MDIKQKLLNDIKQEKLSFKTVQEILRAAPYIGKNKKAQKEAVSALKQLEKEGAILRDARRRYCTGKQAGAFYGTVQGNEGGFAFVLPDDKEKYSGDFFVPKKSLFGAYDKDRVIAAPVRGTKAEAYIIKILKRGVKRFAGTFTADGNRLYVRPDNTRLPEVNIAPSLSLDAVDGNKVMCEITAYRSGGAPNGKITEILGECGKLQTEELAIIREHGLREQFPEAVTAEAQAVNITPSADGRTDLRDKLIFTIDGADTRDIDDAVSLDIKDGKFVLGVHIADVSHYVKPKTALDKEAYARGTSVYFPDRVLPMLPKELSNGICSLNEGEDRLALSCVMTFDKDGTRTCYKIFKSVIKSRHKMTYKDVTAICENDGSVCKKYEDIVSTVKNMQKLSGLLARKRENAGCVNLDIREAKIYIDENGKIVIPDYERGISEIIIEQFMISANEAVAEFLLKNKAPCLYRIHEKPSPEKASALITFLKDLGINAKLNPESVNPADFRDILTCAEDKPYFGVINKVMLRSMQKARYSEINAGHFGLTSDCYCHFTSPIRRYPDLFVHRAVKALLDGNTKALNRYSAFAPAAGTDCSERERIADEAERGVDDLYKLMYMTDKTGEKFDAVISGVTKFGVFCELENTVEGLIPVETLSDTRLEFFPEKFLLKGDKHKFRLGDKIKIRVDNCDFGKMRVMFSIDE